MNFVTRNLGWILLALFFGFMLFIISSNDPQKLKSNTGSEVISTSTGEQNLENLAEKLEAEEKKEEKKEERMDEKEISQEAKLQMKGDKPSLFARLFGKKEEKVLSGSVVQEGGSGVIDAASKEKTAQVNIVREPITMEVVKNTGKQENLVKNTLSETQKLMQDTAWNTHYSIPDADLPGNAIVPEVGKQYSVGVSSLKLNNKAFTQALAYLQKADTLEQIGAANTRGCFEVKVLSSYNAKNIGKTGYVCKKYLEESSLDTQAVQPNTSAEQTVVSETTSLYPQTQIGDIISIASPEARID